MTEKESLTLELDDDVLAELQRRAAAAGCTIDEIAEDIVRRQMALEDDRRRIDPRRAIRASETPDDLKAILFEALDQPYEP
jgi:hypothetical protein